MNPAYFGLIFVAAPFVVGACINFDNSTLDHRESEERRSSRRWGWICATIAAVHLAPIVFGLWTKAILG